MLDHLRPGDIVTVTRLDRLARNTRDLLDIAERLQTSGAGLRSLAEPWADTTSPAGRMVLTVFAGIAEFERSLIVDRTRSGRKAAKERGVRFGRRPTLSPAQIAHARRLMDEEGQTSTEAAALLGVVAVTLLLAGGMKALQTVTIASALPFAVILLMSIYGLLKALRVDAWKRDSKQIATIAPTAARNPIPWQRRLRNIAYFPKRSQVKRFMAEVIYPTMEMVEQELAKQNTVSHTRDDVEDRVRFEVDLGNELNFVYEVRARAYLQPAFALAGMSEGEKAEEQKYYRAVVCLKEGGQDYDVMGWNQEQIINDILDQYEKHLHFLHIVR